MATKKKTTRQKSRPDFLSKTAVRQTVLKLIKSPNRVLPIELPSGKTIELNLKRLTLDELSAGVAHDEKLSKQHDAGEISLKDFILGSWSKYADNIDPDDFTDLEFGHIEQISNALSESIRGARRTEQEKKTNV